MGTIQKLPLEATLVLLEKPFIQLDALITYAFFSFSFRHPLLGSRKETSLFTLLGSMYMSTMFCGVNNASSVLPYVSRERTVLYRERFAGMYASWAYSAAQAVVEIPYILAQTIAFTVITYPMIGYYWSAYKHIPRWWIWFYYVVPTSWSLNGMLTSQFGDIEKEITVFGETKTVAAFLKDYFGYQHRLLPLVAVILLLYPIVFASLFAICIGKLNFQRR